MRAYYGYTLSPNQLETNEGFLICRNVPISRTGDQDYIGTEIGLDDASMHSVHRKSEEVFSDAALASFEGKPVTDDHPPELLTPDTARMYEKGHAQNIRPGIGEWEGYVLADLHIHDRDLIEKIQNGKREISCGYECEYLQEPDGSYSQHKIRGNHIAVVDKGRAGKRAAILDADTKQAQTAPERTESMKKKRNSTLLRLFGVAASGKSEEEISRLAMDTADALEGGEGPEKEPAEDEKPYKERLYESIDPEHMSDEMLDSLAEKIMAKMAARKEAEEAMKEDEDPLATKIEELTGGEAEVPEDDGEARTVPAEEMDMGKACGMDKALASSILRAMRPTVAQIQDKKTRKAVSDALIRCVTTNDGASDIARIIQAAQHNAQRNIKPKQMNIDEIQALYDARNPHKNGGKI